MEGFWSDASFYVDIFSSLRATYDSTLGTYAYMNLTTGWSPIIFTIIQICNLFIINILMLNFMVAILSTSYEEMLESGSFKYKCALFDYCERYMIAFSEDKTFLGEIVVHPPPINVSVILILPFLLLPEK